VRISLNLVVIGIAYALFQHDALIVVGDGDKILGNYGSTAALLNNSAHGILVVVALISLGEIAVDARRLVTR
jgi:hypothetical protein